MVLTLAERSSLIAPSATLAMAAEARRLKSQGVDVFDFALGEPDFKTPENIQDAAIRAMRAGQTHYTPPAGIPELKQALADHYTHKIGLPTQAAQVLVSNGAKHSIHNALMAVTGPGDEVIIPAPYWVSYADLVKLTGAVPVVLETTEESGFKLTPDQFLKAVTPRTKLLMINSPSNPTGVVYDRLELEALADAVLKTNAGVLSDEIYEQLTYGDAKPTCFATLRPGLLDRTITISGVSKTYAMTGWRIGWAIAPVSIAKFMGDLQSQETSNPCSVSQYAALEAIKRPTGIGPDDARPVHEAAVVRPGADRAASGRDLRSAGWGVLRVHERVLSFRPDPGGSRDRRFDLVLSHRAGRGARGVGDGFRLRRRGLCPALVRDRPGDPGSGFRRPRGFSQGLNPDRPMMVGGIREA